MTEPIRSSSDPKTVDPIVIEFGSGALSSKVFVGRPQGDEQVDQEPGLVRQKDVPGLVEKFLHERSRTGSPVPSRPQKPDWRRKCPRQP